MPQRLGESLHFELDRLGVEDGTLAVTRGWAEAVGPDVARNAWPARLRRDGTLVVHARTSVWAFELNQMAEEIRLRLQPVPDGLRFVVGNVPEPVGQTTPEPVSRPPRHPDSTAIAAAESLASDVSSSDVRKALQRAASLALSRPRDDRPM